MDCLQRTIHPANRMDPACTCLMESQNSPSLVQSKDPHQGRWVFFDGDCRLHETLCTLSGFSLDWSVRPPVSRHLCFHWGAGYFGEPNPSCCTDSFRSCGFGDPDEPTEAPGRAETNQLVPKQWRLEWHLEVKWLWTVGQGFGFQHGGFVAFIVLSMWKDLASLAGSVLILSHPTKTCVWVRGRQRPNNTKY